MKKKVRSVSNKAKAPAIRPVPAPKPSPAVVVWPGDILTRYGISAITRWRWEREGKLPPRDFMIGGKVIGWHPATLEAAERGE